MKIALKIFVFLLAIAADALAVIGSVDAFRAQKGIWTDLHVWGADPWVQAPLIVFGTIVLSLVGGDWWANRKIASAGGLTGKEFPARLSHWDKVNFFPIWQVAWLWNGLEPQSGDTQGTAAYPTFRRLKESLVAGLIPNVGKVDDSWLNSTLSRQQLIDYAYRVDDCPPFLFPRRYRQKNFHFFWSLLHREIPFSSAESLERLDTLFSKIYQFSNAPDQETVPISLAGEMGFCANGNRSSEEKYEVATRWMRAVMYAGEWLSYGRLQRDGYLFFYEFIPAWKWENGEISGSEFRWGREVYKDVRVHMKTELIGK